MSTSRGEAVCHRCENFLVLFKGTILCMHCLLTGNSNLQNHCVALTVGTK